MRDADIMFLFEQAIKVFGQLRLEGLDSYIPNGTKVLIHLPPKLPGWMCLEHGFNLFPVSVPKDKIDQNAKDLYSVGF